MFVRPKEVSASKMKESPAASDTKQPRASKKQPKSRDVTPPPMGKISILKREDKQSAADTPLSTPSKATGSVDADLEAALNKVISSSLKRRDAQVYSEIQKTIKNEINESVIPTLSKCISQSIEKTVTKPLQIALVKNSQESSQLRTKEVVKAVTESIQKPISNAFENVSNIFSNSAAVLVKYHFSLENFHRACAI